jgi:hypothetical protein
MTNPITIKPPDEAPAGLPRIRVGSVLRAADGRRFVVKAIRRKQPLDEEELRHQRNAKLRRQPQLNSGFSYARPRADEKDPA